MNGKIDFSVFVHFCPTVHGLHTKGCLHLFFRTKSTSGIVVECYGFTKGYRLYLGNRLLSSKMGK